MKKVLFFLLLFRMSFSVDLPAEPESPKINEDFSTEIPQIEDPFSEMKTNSFVYYVRTRLYFSDGKNKERVLIFSNVDLISVTNSEDDTKKIYTFSLYQIEKIEIIKWKASSLSNNIYLFSPDFYRIYLKTESPGTTNFVEIKNNIAYFNVLSSKTEEKLENYYTIFYDYWISGKNKFFRWKNSRSMVFDYNFTNPLPDVVVKIEFLW
ncbi:MAG: hypothetical protein ACP5QT_06585 [Brevinematia bacterium]